MLPLSLILVKNPVLDPHYLDFVIDALNQQSDRRFNTFWLDQSPDPKPLQAQLKQAHFPWQAFHTRGPTVAGINCWELVHAFAFLMEQPAMGSAFTYLHMECIPATDFVAQILTTLPEIETNLGPDFICMLQQLWCPLTLAELHPRHYLEQIRHIDLYTWGVHVLYDDYRRYSFAWFEQPWQEDAFLMPSALARKLKLFSAVRLPLFFQDLFDIFPNLVGKPYCREIRWVRLPTALCYHLQHPRPFLEFSRDFLDGVRSHPELFGHAGMYDVALTDQSFTESESLRQLDLGTDQLDSLYVQFRRGPRGTVTLWLQALDEAHRQLT